MRKRALTVLMGYLLATCSRPTVTLVYGTHVNGHPPNTVGGQSGATNGGDADETHKHGGGADRRWQVRHHPHPS